MTIRKTIITAVAMLAISLLSHTAQALNAANLYMERTCIACHGAEGRAAAMDEYPKLAGQSEQYLLTQMTDIKNGKRTNAHSMAMKNVMHLINEDEMAAIATWLAGLPEK